MNPELEKLRTAQARDLKILEQLQHQRQRLQNRIAYLEKRERQKRAHRLIAKGAAIEHLIPATKEMSEGDFYSLMEKILSLSDVTALLSKEADE